MVVFMNKDDFRKPKEGEYIFLLIKFDNSKYDKTYYYLAKQSHKVLPGDFVEVRNLNNSFYNKETSVAEVLFKTIYTKENAPFPVEKTKTIIRVLRNLNRRGLRDLNSYDTLEKISQIEDLENEIKEYVVRKILGKSKLNYKNDPCYDEEKKSIEKEFKMGLGFCHIYWSYKKDFLKEDYGIDWLSPSECNPHVLFD